MKTKTKAVVTVICVLALIATAVFGSLAYLTDQEQKINTFTVGKVDITLTEPNYQPGEGGISNILPGVEIAKDPTIEVVKGPAWVVLELDMNKYISLINLMGVDAYLNGVGGLTGTYLGPQAFLTMSKATFQAVIDRWFIGIEHTNWMIMNTAEIQQAFTDAASQSNPEHLKIRLGFIGGIDTVGRVMAVNESVKFMTKFMMPETVTQSMMDGADAYYPQGSSTPASNFNTGLANWDLTFTAYAIQDKPFTNITDAYNALNLPAYPWP